MLEALHALDLDLQTLFNNVFDTDQGGTFEDVGWFKGLFCADLPTMERMGEAFSRGQGDDALRLALSGEQCANLKNLYELDMKYFGKVYSFQGDYIQVVGVVPHGAPGPMSYVFIKLDTLAS